MKPVSCLVGERLRREIYREAVKGGYSLYNLTKCYGIVCGSKRRSVSEVDLVLPRSLFMMGAFRLHSKVF